MWNKLFLFRGEKTSQTETDIMFTFVLEIVIIMYFHKRIGEIKKAHVFAMTYGVHSSNSFVFKSVDFIFFN